MLRHLVPLVLALASGASSTCNSESASTPPDSTRGATMTEAQCVDKWLADNHLDQYGNKAGTMYAGGTPLFDESTGKTTDRLEYIYQNHPESKAACHK